MADAELFGLNCSLLRLVEVYWLGGGGFNACVSEIHACCCICMQTNRRTGATAVCTRPITLLASYTCSVATISSQDCLACCAAWHLEPIWLHALHLHTDLDWISVTKA